MAARTYHGRTHRGDTYAGHIYVLLPPLIYILDAYSSPSYIYACLRLQAFSSSYSGAAAASAGAAGMGPAFASRAPSVASRVLFSRRRSATVAASSGGGGVDMAGCDAVDRPERHPVFLQTLLSTNADAEPYGDGEVEGAKLQP